MSWSAGFEKYHGPPPDMRPWLRRKKRLKRKKRVTTPLAIGFWVGIVLGFLFLVLGQLISWFQVLAMIFGVGGILCGTVWMYIWSPIDTDGSYGELSLEDYKETNGS